MDTVTLSNGLKALFGTSQSTATNIPTCAADGTPAGNISVANLASVLGVGASFLTISSGQSFNSIPVKEGYYLVDVEVGATDTPYTLTSATSFVVRITKIVAGNNTGRFLEEAYPRNNSTQLIEKYYARWLGDGSSVHMNDPWNQLSVPSFLKSYDSLSSLASALGVQLSSKSAVESMSANLKINYPAKIVTGTFNTNTSNAPTFIAGETSGAYIWIPCALQEGNSFGILLASTLNGNYEYRYHICTKWYQNWGDWKTL